MSKGTRGGTATGDPLVMRAVHGLLPELLARGARAVVLFGSHVRGDAYPESDIDLVAIGRGPAYRLERHGGYLFSLSWGTAQRQRRSFRQPSEVGGCIPGWRSAVILQDPEGLARDLQEEARAWTWDALGRTCDSWVAEQIAGYAEEVHKLVGNLELGRSRAAAVQRSLLALRMAPILAVHHRILYDTENQLWDLVASKMGQPWARVQDRALGLGGGDFEATCKAALELYWITSSEVRHLLDDRQREVVAHACALAGRPL